MAKRKPKAKTPDCPDWLEPQARAAWEWLIPQLSAKGVLDEIDRNALIRYCVTWGRWKDAEQFLAKHGSVYPVKGDDGTVKQMREFPQVGIANKLASILGKLEQEFGLTPQVTARQLADWCGVSVSKIGRMVRDGLPREANGFDLGKALQWFQEGRDKFTALRTRFDKIKDLSDGHKAIKMEQDAVALAARKDMLIDKEWTEIKQVQQVHRVRTELERLPSTVARKHGLSKEVESGLRSEIERICNRFAEG